MRLKLIADVNILLAAILRDSITRRIILEDYFDLYSVDLLERVLLNKINLISSKTGLSSKKINKIIGILFSHLTIVDYRIYSLKWHEAGKIISKIDKEDTPYIALALSIENDGIWTEDKHFLKQNRIKIWKTIELVRYIKGV